MIVGFTGTQEGMSLKQKENLRWFFDSMAITELRHGDCIGADEQAHDILLDSTIGYEDSVRIFLHPPANPSKRAYCDIGRTTYVKVTRLEEKDYLDRNKDIVDASQLLIVAPRTYDEEIRSGTWSTYRYAKGKIPRLIL